MTAPLRVFVTVGTELPFDRLVGAVDRWTVDRGGDAEVMAQIGDSEHPPTAIDWARFIDGPQFHELFCAADLVVSHAGMGTILSALQYERPLLVMPRRAALGEHRNDHQMATALRLSQSGRVNVAFDDAELLARLDGGDIRAKPRIGPYADGALIEAVREVVHQHRSER